ncbi:MAG: hypothetical protein RSB93_00880 [Rikenellaceae bacterium]
MSTERLIFNQAVSYQTELTDLKYIDDLINQYPWFNMLHMMKLKVLDGKKADKYRCSNALTLFANSYYNILNNKSYSDFSALQDELKKKQFCDFPKSSSLDSSSIINSFLSIDLSKRKIEDVENKYVNVDLANDDDEGLVSEDIASVYVKLGEFQEAAKIYCKLSLKYPEKSAYFADAIKKLNNK